MVQATILKFDKALAFQIESQTPECRQYLKSIDGNFVASNGWQVTSHQVPELNVMGKVIFLRGTDSGADLRVDRTWDLDSNYARDRIIEEVQVALAQFNEAVARFSVIQSSPTIPLEGIMEGIVFTLATLDASEAALARSEDSANTIPANKPIVSR